MREVLCICSEMGAHELLARRTRRDVAGGWGLEVLRQRGRGRRVVGCREAHGFRQRSSRRRRAGDAEGREGHGTAQAQADGARGGRGRRRGGDARERTAAGMGSAWRWSSWERAAAELGRARRRRAGARDGGDGRRAAAELREAGAASSPGGARRRSCGKSGVGRAAEKVERRKGMCTGVGDGMGC